MCSFPFKLCSKIRKQLVYNLLIFVSFLAGCSGTSQETIANDGSFGIDKTHNIIVWHLKNLDSLRQVNGAIKTIRFGPEFGAVGTSGALSYETSSQVEHKGISYDLYITKLPIVHIDIAKTIKDEIKNPGRFTYFFGNTLTTNTVGIEHRGNLSLTFPKKSYDLEFWKDSVQKISTDVKFQGLKKDDDFILDGLYNEPLRLRSTLSLKLWKSLHRPYYHDSAPHARSVVDARYVELFKNGGYQGIYALTGSVDQSLLELKRNEGKTIHGELFKASSYEGGPSFLKAPPYNDLFPHWAGFEMEYPILDYRSHWKNLSAFVNLVVKADDEQFVGEIGKSVQIDNAIDYYLFVNLLRATDNLGKNYYLGRYDENAPYFFVPWDLDGVMGIIQDGKRIPTTNDLLSNGLFDRLLKTNPDNFREKLKTRWAALRKTKYSDASLFGHLERMYTDMGNDRVYERERKIWPGEKTEEEQYEYLKDWLTDRLTYLDKHFKVMPSATEGGSVR